MTIVGDRIRVTLHPCSCGSTPFVKKVTRDDGVWWQVVCYEHYQGNKNYDDGAVMMMVRDHMSVAFEWNDHRQNDDPRTVRM